MKTLKIVLVDDQEISNFINKKVIGLSGLDCEIIEFTDPVHAFEQLPTINPDLILLDLQMPVLNGWQFLDKMVDVSHKHPVAIITSSTSSEDTAKSLTYSHVVEYCVKPIKPEIIKGLAEKLMKPVV